MESERQALTTAGYRLLSPLGAGGQAAVYLAIDPLGRRVAVKRVRCDAAHRAASLRREARLMASVSHPNVVRVHTLEELSGELFLVMEHVDGVTLADCLRRVGRLPVAQAADVVAQVASGLAAAHEKGIVHRDVKPGNIMLCGDGRALVIDFGTAFGGDEASSCTLVQASAHYVAPERIQGRDGDFRSDVYSLGVVLYEMVSGTPPFTGGTAQSIAARHATESIPDLRRARSEVRRELTSLCRWMTRKQPHRRPSSYPVLLAEIDRLRPLLDEETDTRGAGLRTLLRRFGRACRGLQAKDPSG